MTDLSQAFTDCRPQVKIRTIIAHVAKLTGVPKSDILSPKRDKPTVRARHMVMWKAHQEGYALGQIGNVLQRDHTTVLYGIRNINRKLGL